MDRRRALMMAQGKVLYLYSHGDECVNITGGWVSTDKREITTGYVTPSRAPYVFRDEEYMHVTQVDSQGAHKIGWGTVFPSLPIDFTNYKTLVVDGRFEASGYGRASVVITPYPAENVYDPFHTVVTAYGKIVDTITEYDISNFFGLWLVGIVSSVSQARQDWKKDAYIREIYLK